MMIMLPVAAIIILKKMKPKLTKPDVQASYSTLYTNVRINSKVSGDLPLWSTSLFLGKRLVIAFLTVSLEENPLS